MNTIKELNFENIQVSQDKRRIDLPGKVLVAHQADFMPWLGFFSKACMGDLFLVLDDTQFKTKNFQNRNRIRFPNKEGWMWITIPVEKNTAHFQNMLNVKILNDDWKRHHLKSIKISYSKSPFFENIFSEISRFINESTDSLVELNLSLIKYGFEKFRINLPFYRVSDLITHGLEIRGKKNELVLSLCKVVKADVLVLGSGGRDYADIEFFKKNNVKVVFQDFNHPVYNQYHGSFLPFMSFIDLLFNQSLDNSYEILKKSNYKLI